MLAAGGGWLVAWHGSLQHETIHGRPTGVAWIDGLIGVWPLALWLPYARYRDSHLRHHATGHLTYPEHDPESRYLRAGEKGWRARARETDAWLQSTLLGRLLLGPILEVAAFAAGEALRLLRGDGPTWRAWLLHAPPLAAVLLWLHLCGLGLDRYLCAFVLPGAALTLLRSYAEHRADPDPHRRAAIVERAPILGLLFLNNNLHALHHARPDLPWWRLPAVYRRTRAALLAANGGLVYRGYGEVFARFWRRPHDAIHHPDAVPSA